MGGHDAAKEEKSSENSGREKRRRTEEAGVGQSLGEDKGH